MSSLMLYPLLPAILRREKSTAVRSTVRTPMCAEHLQSLKSHVRGPQVLAQPLMGWCYLHILMLWRVGC